MNAIIRLELSDTDADDETLQRISEDVLKALRRQDQEVNRAPAGPLAEGMKGPALDSASQLLVNVGSTAGVTALIGVLKGYVSLRTSRGFTIKTGGRELTVRGASAANVDEAVSRFFSEAAD